MRKSRGKTSPEEPKTQVMVAAEPPKIEDTKISDEQLYAEAIDKIENSEFSRLTRKHVEALFKVFDLDTNGYISVSEIKARFQSKVEDDPSKKSKKTTEPKTSGWIPSESVREQMQQIVSQADSSGDGLIDVEEFYQALCLNIDANPYKRVLRGAEQKKEVWVRRQDIVSFLSQRAETISSCQWLPFYVIFFALSFILVIVHLQVEEVHRSLDSVRGSFSDVGDTVNGWSSLEDDFLDWLSGTLVETTNLDATVLPGRIQKDNQILGGVKLKMAKSSPQICANPPDTNLDFYFDLKAALNATARNKDLKICRNPEGDFSDAHWLLLTHAAEKIRELKNEGWIDKDSMEIEITWFTYNAHSRFYVVSKLIFARNKFGKVEFDSTYEAFSADPYNGGSTSLMIGCDCLFSAMVLFMLVNELYEYIPTLWRNGLRKGNRLYWNIWNAIDWFNITMSMIICLLYYVTVSRVSTMNMLIQEMPVSKLNQCITTPATCGTPINGGKSITQILEQSTDQANVVGFYYYVLRGIAVVFAFSTMLAFFKAFRANPRLRVVTDTMVKAKEDLVHFLVVFLSIFFVFVLSGYILFGNRMKLFYNARTAIDTCGMMTLGFVIDDVREDMLEAFPVLSVIWIWAFYIVLSILLLNMILAIIFDVYGDVKAKTGDAETIFAQAKDMYYRKSRKIQEAAKRVSLRSQQAQKAKMNAWGDSAVLRYLAEKNYHEGDIVTTESLTEAFGKTFPPERGSDLLSEVDLQLRNDKMIPETTTEDILRLVGRVDQNVRDLRAERHQDEEKERHQDEEKAAKLLTESRVTTCSEPTIVEISSQSPKAASAREVSILGARVKRLESYTAYRMDMIEDKFQLLINRLDRLLPGDGDDGGEDQILSILRNLDKREDRGEFHE